MNSFGYFVDDWRLWFESCSVAPPAHLAGPLFDSSLAMVHCALQGLGVALAPPVMFARELAQGSLVQPFATRLHAGGYWLTQLPLREPRTGAAVRAVAAAGAVGTARRRLTPPADGLRPCVCSRRS